MKEKMLQIPLFYAIFLMGFPWLWRPLTSHYRFVMLFNSGLVSLIRPANNSVHDSVCDRRKLMFFLLRQAPKVWTTRPWFPQNLKVFLQITGAGWLALFCVFNLLTLLR